MKFFRARIFSRWVAVPLAFALGLLAGLLIQLRLSDEKSSSAVEIRQGGYRFTNPLLDCEVAGDAVEFVELQSFKHKVRTLIDRNTAKRDVSHVSVYFRDLNNGPWFGINAGEGFSPASLLKVPIMIAYLKLASSDLSLLKREILYSEGDEKNRSENIKAAKSIEPGRRYLVEDLLYMMIVHSDNNAMTLLAKNLDPRVLSDVYVDLGIDIPGAIKPEDFMSVKSFASFFRILFNASYLNREMSEKALNLLSQVNFKDGLVAGVPRGIVVAHKFGERAYDSDQVKQMHDCGIVYYPEHPYLLCVMTRGRNFETLDDTIREISRLVYAEVDRQYKDKLKFSSNEKGPSQT